MTDIDDDWPNYRREAESLISAIDGTPADTRLERVAHWLADFLDRLEEARWIEFYYQRSKAKAEAEAEARSPVASPSEDDELPF
jgi:hypothetical protein